VTRTPLSRLKGQRSRSPGCFTHRGVYASCSCSGDRGNVFTVGTYCYVPVRRGRLGGARREAPTEVGEGCGILWRLPHSLFKLVKLMNYLFCFYARDAMHKRGLCCRPVSVRLYVCCPSHWWIVSTWLKISSNFLFGPVAPSLQFFTLSAGTQFQGELPSTGTLTTRGWEKLAISD